MSQPTDITTHVEPTHQERVVIDATRAMVIQNARFSQRFDVVEKWRSPRFRKVLADIGAVVCGLGGLLAGLSVAIEWTDTGEIPWLRVGLLVLMIGLFVLFQSLDWVMKAGYRRINERLHDIARKMLRAAGERLPATVEYELNGDAIRGVWRDENGEQLASWSHELDDDAYVLAGSACFVGFDGSRKRSPSFFCYVDEESAERLRAALVSQGIEVEDIERDLMLDKDEMRPWPFEQDDA